MKIAIAAVVVALLVAVALFAMRRRIPRDRPAVSAAPKMMVDALRRDVETLCGFGERNTFVPKNLFAAADFIEGELRSAGYEVERQLYDVPEDGVRVANLIVELRGATQPNDIVVIGAHYDSVEGTAGADDNASGVAALLSLARKYAHAKPAKTLRFVAFANEEPPHFQTQSMGSWQYARRCYEKRENIVAMLSLETIGYYSDAPGSQQYPPPLAAMYPSTGNFIGFASNVGSRGLTSRCVKAFKGRTAFPVESASLPEAIPGIGWSDQWAFWQFGWKAVMVTDTAPFRNPHYHRPSDRPSTLDYERLAQVVDGLDGVVGDLTR
ncbi:MAG: M28 family peptidase [Acidobacteriota bacterium]|nr:M28 family peptidase [Acidobacteriota bacterium]